MRRPRTTHSHLVCPTCWSDLSNTDVKDLGYFGCNAGPLKNDDVANLYEEAYRLVLFLGALAKDHETKPERSRMIHAANSSHPK